MNGGILFGFGAHITHTFAAHVVFCTKFRKHILTSLYRRRSWVRERSRGRLNSLELVPRIKGWQNGHIQCVRDALHVNCTQLADFDEVRSGLNVDPAAVSQPRRLLRPFAPRLLPRFIGVNLLQEVFRIARLFGVDELGHVMDSPGQWPQWQFHEGERAALLESQGFRVDRVMHRLSFMREKQSFHHSTNGNCFFAP